VKSLIDLYAFNIYVPIDVDYTKLRYRSNIIRPTATESGKITGKYASLISEHIADNTALVNYLQLNENERREMITEAMKLKEIFTSINLKTDKRKMSNIVSAEREIKKQRSKMGLDRNSEDAKQAVTTINQPIDKTSEIKDHVENKQDQVKADDKKQGKKKKQTKNKERENI